MSQESPGLRELNVEARRQRILAAARVRIAEGGMDALTMRPLAREAGLSVTTLYNLFGSRKDIVAALVDDAMDRMDEILEQEAPLEDPFERCRAVITVSIRHFTLHEAIFRPVLIAGHQAPSIASRRHRETTERAARMQRVAIEAAIEQGLLSDLLDPTQLGRQIFHGYDLASIQWATGLIDAETFEARALYGLYVALLGVAQAPLRERIERELARTERVLEGELPWRSRNRSASSAS